MKTSPPPPRPAVDLSQPMYYQLVYTLTGLLPPPLDDSPEALRARNYAAIAKVAALMPVGANEIDLAAHCIAARAQAEEMLRQVRENADDIELVLRLNAQYGSMVRTSLSVHGRLMRVQALRQKREAIEGAANQDAWTQHIAEQCMLIVADPDAVRQQPARSTAAPASFSKVVATNATIMTGEAPPSAPLPHPDAEGHERQASALHDDGGVLDPESVLDTEYQDGSFGAPAAGVDQGLAGHVSNGGTNSHDAAFETWLNTLPWRRGTKGSGKTGRREVLHAAMAEPRAAGRDTPAKSHESLGRANPSGHGS